MAMAVKQAMLAITATDTREVLASDQDVDWVLLWAPFSNEQVIRIGDTSVTNTDASTEGLPIVPGALPIKLGPCNLNDINVIGFATDKIYYFGSDGYTLGTGS